MTNPTATLTTTQQSFQVDPAHTQVNFAVRHLGFSKVRGRFESFQGVIRMTPEQVDSIEAEATIQVTTLSTGDDKRDNHLRSADFFKVETYPELTFASTGVRNVSGSNFKLAGRLTIRGITKDVELDAEFLGEAKDPWGGTRIAIEASTKINRKDFGLNWNQVLEAGGFLVGDTVEITIEAQAVLEEV